MSTTDTPVATVYLAKDFGGDGHPMPPGGYNLDHSTTAEHTISSIRVPDGWTVTVYRDRDFAGESTAFTADTPDLGDFDNAASLTISDQPPASRNLSVGSFEESGEPTGISVDIEGGLLLLPPSVYNFDYSFTVATTTTQLPD